MEINKSLDDLKIELKYKKEKHISIQKELQFLDTEIEDLKSEIKQKLFDSWKNS